MIAQQVALLASLLSAAFTLGARGAVLNVQRQHLRSGTEAEWADFDNLRPDGKRLDLSFTSQSNAQEQTLFIRQDDVRHDWFVELNRKRIGKLFLMEADLIHTIAIPPGALRNGTNALSILPPRDNDDIFIHEIRLDPRPRREAVAEAVLHITSRDAATGRAMPSRVTIVTRDGVFAPLLAPTNAPAAVRPGVVYHSGETSLGIPEGDYTIYASRGFEWSVATQQVRVSKSAATRVEFTLKREVPTPDYICTDTHIHKATNHGDATEDERALTLAGEGIEMPITTEHNTNSGYGAATERMGLRAWFTPVMGNEVTTTVGHFNIFPVETGPAPNYRLIDWPQLMTELRGAPGVRVVILNHPLNIHNNFQPFAATNYDAATGDNLRGFDFSFDATELLNSSAQQSDYMAVYRGWFGLLNHGYRVTGVGSSDSHDVSRYIVGQGRTYIRSADSNPDRIDVPVACSNLLAGRALVSMGLLTDIRVNDQFRVGDLATNLGSHFRVSARVLAPSWSSATNLALYANGILLREESLPFVHDRTVSWDIPRPKHDVHLVAIATGPGITAPYWAIPRPYQPTSMKWHGRVIASTNPVWVDADGDGRFTSARDLAQAMVRSAAGDKSKLQALLRDADESVRAQVARLEQR